jgi:hypothetical protein
MLTSINVFQTMPRHIKALSIFTCFPRRDARNPSSVETSGEQNCHEEKHSHYDSDREEDKRARVNFLLFALPFSTVCRTPINMMCSVTNGLSSLSSRPPAMVVTSENPTSPEVTLQLQLLGKAQFELTCYPQQRPSS